MSSQSTGPSLFAAGVGRKRPRPPAIESLLPRTAGASAGTTNATAAVTRDGGGGGGVDGGDATFSTLGVAGWLIKACAAMGIRVPTPIQRAAIPAILSGRDLVGCAQTGSGKTAAFAVPILQRCMEDPWGPFALVLTPSRELALQIADQFTVLGGPARVRVATVVGGMDIVAQGLALSTQPHIIIATPGRLAHHLTLGTAPPDLSRLAFLVLDEADRLLEGPFHPDLHTILQAAAPKPGAPPRPPRQTLLFSATVTPDALTTATEPAAPEVAALAAEAAVASAVSHGKGKKGAAAASATATAAALSRPPIVTQLALRDPLYVDVTPRDLTTAVTVAALRQHYVFMPETVKNAYLWHVLTLLLAPAAIPHAVGVEDALRGKGGARGHRKPAHKHTTPPTATARNAFTLPTASTAVMMGRTNPAHARRADGGEEGEEEDDMEEGGDSADEAHDVDGGGRGAARGHGRPPFATALAAAGAGGDDADAEDVVGVARSAIVFTGTCLSCQTVTEMLQELGVPCAPLHSVMPQGKRISSLAKFKSSLVPVLVATDVASRGLDIPTVDLVVNYDLPRLPSDYIHRVGRTARAGRRGHAVSLVTQYDVRLLQTVEEKVLHGAKMAALPGVEEEVVLRKLAKVATAVKLASHRLEETGFNEALEVHEGRKAEATARSRAFQAGGEGEGDADGGDGGGDDVTGESSAAPAAGDGAAAVRKRRRVGAPAAVDGVEPDSAPAVDVAGDRAVASSKRTDVGAGGRGKGKRPQGSAGKS